MATPTITKVSPLMATRGATGTTITITGTNFGASGGTVTIGGVTAIAGTWSATSITVQADDSPVTPLGSQDVVVLTSADGNVTHEKGVFVYNATENFTTTEMAANKIKGVYIDGVHIGYTEDTISMTPTFQTEDLISNNRIYPVGTNVTGATMSLSLTLMQVNGANLAMVSGGTWDAGTKMLTFSGTPTIPSHSVAVIEATSLAQYTFPNCQLITPSAIVLGSPTHKKLSITLRALPIADDASNVAQVYIP